MEKYLKLAKKYWKVKKAYWSRTYKDLLLVGLKMAVFIIAAVLVIGILTPATQAANGINPKIKQVRTAQSSAVYYLDHKRGLKKAYTSPAAFLSYGNKWSDVKVIAQSQLDSWPSVNLIKTAGNPGVYYIYGNQKALIKSEAEFTGLGFGWNDIVTVSNTDFNSYKTADLDNLVITSAPAEAQLNITLDPSSPKDNVAVINTKDNLAAIFDFTSNDGEPIKISSIAFSLKGVVSAEAIKNIYIANESGTKYDIPFLLDNRIVNFNFSDAGIIITPGETKKIRVYVDLAGSKNNQSQTYQIGLESARAVNSAATIAASFPVTGGKFTIVAADGLLGKMTLTEESLNNYNRQAIIGSTEQAAAKFTLAETSKNEDLILKKIVIKNIGTAGPGMLANFKLKNQAGKIIAQTRSMDSELKVSFSLNDYEIARNSKETFTVLVDIADGDGKTFNLNIIEVSATGKNVGLSLGATITSVDESVTINRVYLGVVSKDLTANSRVTSQQKGVIIGNFEIRNNNKKVTLQSLEFSLTKSAKAPALDSTVYLVNYNTGEIYGSIDGAKLSAGNTAISLVPLSLDAKKSAVVTLITDIPLYTNSGDYYQITLTKINYSGDNSIPYSDAVRAPGVRLNVTKSAIYAYPNNDLKGLTYIKGQKGVTVASFIIETSAGEDVAINGLTFANGASSALISYENGFSNLRAYIDGRMVGEVVKAPFGATFAASGFNYRLKAGNRATIKVVADTVIDLRASETQLVLNQITANGYSSGIPTTVAGINIASLSVAYDVSSLEITAESGGQITAGTTKNLVASFKITNDGAENVSLRNITVVTSSAGFSHSLGYSNLKIIRHADNYQAGKVSEPVSGANSVGLSYARVKPGESVTFDVYVDADSDVTADSFGVYFTDLSAKGEVSSLEPDIQGTPTNSVAVTVN